MAHRVIALNGQPVYNEDGAAGEAITPGMLVKGTATILKHATAGGAAAKRFALERDEGGRDIDDAYAIGDTVKVGAFCPGQQVLAWIASGQNIAADAFLESGAVAGTLRVFSSGVIVGRAMEAVNNTAGPSNARIRIEVY